MVLVGLSVPIAPVPTIYNVKGKRLQLLESIAHNGLPQAENLRVESLIVSSAHT